MQFDQSRDEWLISVDDHVIEPPDVWVTRLPAKHRDAGPRWVADASGEAWLFGDERLAVGGAVTNGALDPTDVRPPVFTPLPWSEVPSVLRELSFRDEISEGLAQHALERFLAR